MTKKNLIFYTTILAFGATAVNAANLEYLEPEDEILLYENSGVGAYVPEDIYQTHYKTNHSDYVVEDIPVGHFHNEQRSLKPIAVPEYINERAPEYDNPELIKVRPDTPRSVIYPIGEERREADSWRRRRYEPNFMRRAPQSPEQLYHKRMMVHYRPMINSCTEGKYDYLNMEISLLRQGNLYDNAAVLSETLSDVENCYDEVGQDIIENLYDNDADVWDSYKKKITEFHVDSSGPSFNPKYCKETCSLEAVAALQVEKFADYRVYLAKLILEAPYQTSESFPPERDFDEDSDAPYIEEDDIPYIDEEAPYIAPTPRRNKPRTVTVARPNEWEDMDEVVYIDD